MKVCDLCNRQYPRRVDFTEYAMHGGERLLICGICALRVQQGRPVEAPAEVAARPPGAVGAAERRVHERREASLQLRFQKLRETKVYNGLMRDVSQGGVRFTTDVPLLSGDVINIWVMGPRGVGIRGVVRVVRIRAKASQRTKRIEVGGRFVGAGVNLTARDRRRTSRVLAEFRIHYRPQGQRDERVGRVRDVSRGGLRFFARELLQPGVFLEVRMEAGEIAWVHADLTAAMAVVDCTRRGPGEAESGVLPALHIGATPANAGLVDLNHEVRARFLSA